MIFMLDSIPTNSPNYNKPIIGYKSILSYPVLVNSSGAPQDGSANNLWSPDTYTKYNAYGVTDDHIIFQDHLTAEKQFDYIGIVGHNFVGSGIRLRFNYRDSLGQIMQLFDINSTSITSNDPILICVNSISSNYLVLRLTYSSIKPSIAHLKIGQRTTLEMPCWMGDSPLIMSQDVQSRNQISRNGKYLGSINQMVSKSCKIDQEYNSENFVYQHLRNFIAHCDGTKTNTNESPRTFFYAPRPHRSVPSGDQKDIIYGWAKNQIKPVQQVNNMYSWSVDVDGVA
jgi:hypothetical protein